VFFHLPLVITGFSPSKFLFLTSSHPPKPSRKFSLYSCPPTHSGLSFPVHACNRLDGNHVSFPSTSPQAPLAADLCPPFDSFWPMIISHFTLRGFFGTFLSPPNCGFVRLLAPARIVFLPDLFPFLSTSFRHMSLSGPFFYPRSS